MSDQKCENWRRVLFKGLVHVPEARQHEQQSIHSYKQFPQGTPTQLASDRQIIALSLAAQSE